MPNVYFLCENIKISVGLGAKDIEHQTDVVLFGINKWIER